MCATIPSHRRHGWHQAVIVAVSRKMSLSRRVITHSMPDLRHHCASPVEWHHLCHYLPGTGCAGSDEVPDCCTVPSRSWLADSAGRQTLYQHDYYSGTSWCSAPLTLVEQEFSHAGWCHNPLIQEWNIGQQVFCLSLLCIVSHHYARNDGCRGHQNKLCLLPSEHNVNNCAFWHFEVSRRAQLC